jgi:hypothetical protein
MELCLFINLFAAARIPVRPGDCAKVQNAAFPSKPEQANPAYR